MVDGFIQNEEGTALRNQCPKLQARAFAKGKFMRGAQGDIAFEEEVMEEVARIRFVKWGNRLYGLQGAEVWVE